MKSFIVGAMLRLESVSLSYSSGWLVKKETPVIRNVSFEMEPESIVGLVGASGSGKSTLAKLMLGIIHPNRGRVLFADHQDIFKLSPSGRRLFRQNVQFVAQHPEAVFNPKLKISTSIIEVIRHFRLCSPGSEKRFLEPLLRKLKLNVNYMDRYPLQLSGGEIQRLALARALLPNPRLVILDEATSMLDVSVQAHLAHLLLEVHAAQKTAFLFITHNLPLAQKICHKTYEVSEGRLM